MACPGAVSSFGEILVVSTNARPTGVDLYAGRRIYEADTGREMLYDGTGWVIMSEPLNTDNVTAAFTGFTTGTPSYATTYHRSDGWVDVVSTLTFGLTPGSLTTLTWAPPISAQFPLGGLNVTMFDASAGNWYPGSINEDNATTTTLFALSAAGATAVIVAPSLSVPFTWAISDRVVVSGRYRATTRYL